VDQLLGAMCPSARRLRAVKGRVPLRTLLPAAPLDALLDMPAYVPTLGNRHEVAVKSASRASTHTHGHTDGSHTHGPELGEGCHHTGGVVKEGGPPSHATHGLSTFVYRHDRLFDPRRLVHTHTHTHTQIHRPCSVASWGLSPLTLALVMALVMVRDQWLWIRKEWGCSVVWYAPKDS
jgi:G3E family GTPase